MALTVTLAAPSVTAQPKPADTHAAVTKVAFKGPAASDQFSMSGNGTQGTYDPAGGKALKFAIDTTTHKMITKDGSDKIIGFLKYANGQKWKLEDSTGKDLYVLKKEPDGHYKLKDAAGNTLYVVKSEDYGCKIENGENAAVAKIHKHENKLSLKSKDDKEILSTHSDTDPIVLACFAFDALDKNQRAELAYALNFVRN